MSLATHVFFLNFRLRQYPLYSKKEPPKALAAHFTPEVFKKSQEYGKDKARYALVSGLLKQVLESLMLHYGIYAWGWDVAGRLLGMFGYGEEYEVRYDFSLPDDHSLSVGYIHR